MAWHGSRSTTVRRRGSRGMATAAVALAVSIGVVAAGVSPAGAWDDDPADEIAAWSSALPGFVLSGESWFAFEAPEPDVAIYPSGINDGGATTGEYIRSDGESGFVRNPEGQLTTFDVPGARATEASKINDGGQIVGRYSEDTRLVDDSSRVRGFVRQPQGTITRIDFPGATHTLPTGINDGGDVVGYYVDEGGATHGFLWRDRRFTPLDLVGASSPTPMDINDNGEVVGMFLDEAGVARGFLLIGESYTTISGPGSSATVPSGINDDGEVVGYTADDLMLTGARGFRGTPSAASGYQSVAVPGAPRTLPLGINDNGDVVGLNESPDETASWPNAAEEWTAMSAGGSDGNGELATVRGITVNAAIAGQVEALLAAAEADGFTFTGGGHRSPERQIELRRQNCGTSYYAVYEMPSSQCSPPTARPGRSLHERGLAIDFNCRGSLVDSRSDPCFQWLAANAARFGLFNLPSEPWHWSVNGQ
jgi:probable HAF family extracellular repeat protein